MTGSGSHREQLRDQIAKAALAADGDEGYEAPWEEHIADVVLADLEAAGLVGQPTAPEGMTADELRAIRRTAFLLTKDEKLLDAWADALELRETPE